MLQPSAVSTYRRDIELDISGLLTVVHIGDWNIHICSILPFFVNDEDCLELHYKDRNEGIDGSTLN